jgi:acyl-CoA synthetase (AMP-forming)/AMP-acid ligase II
MGTLLAGATFILAEKFSASRLWSWTRRYQANKMVLLLALTTILYNRPPASDDADNPVEVVVAGGVPAGCYVDFQRRFDVKLQTLYSLTEAPLAVMSPPEEPCVDGAVGVPMDIGGEERNEIRIVDDKLTEVPRGIAGEIAIRNPAVMKAYLKDAAATRQTLVDGWLRTGDRGTMDERGWIRFLGRAKDVIRKKGENISAAQVEQVIVQHPAVSETAVVGVRPEDAVGEEEVMAFVVADRNAAIDWGELIAHCQSQLAAFKVPRFWKSVSELPKNAMNRVVKARLIEGDRPEQRPGTFDRERDGSLE